MPETTARIRAVGSALVVPSLALMVAWNASIASNERTLARRLDLAKTELAREQARNTAAHAASLADRTSTKAVAAANSRELAALRAQVAALKTELAALRAKGQ